jgi:hypothetical protein
VRAGTGREEIVVPGGARSNREERFTHFRSTRQF